MNPSYHFSWANAVPRPFRPFRPFRADSGPRPFRLCRPLSDVTSRILWYHENECGRMVHSDHWQIVNSYHLNRKEESWWIVHTDHWQTGRTNNFRKAHVDPVYYEDERWWILHTCHCQKVHKNHCWTANSYHERGKNKRGRKVPAESCIPYLTSWVRMLNCSQCNLI